MSKKVVTHFSPPKICILHSLRDVSYNSLSSQNNTQDNTRDEYKDQDSHKDQDSLTNTVFKQKQETKKGSHHRDRQHS